MNDVDAAAVSGLAKRVRWPLGRVLLSCGLKAGIQNSSAADYVSLAVSPKRFLPQGMVSLRAAKADC
jgi:hypothetical protein